MKPEEQRIKIAEACGWSAPFVVADGGIEGAGKYCRLPVPDYLNDLNAMHEAEKVLFDYQWDTYIDLLCRGDLFELAHATAAQRAEAFLRTLSLWTP